MHAARRHDPTSAVYIERQGCDPLSVLHTRLGSASTVGADLLEIQECAVRDRCRSGILYVRSEFHYNSLINVA